MLIAISRKIEDFIRTIGLVIIDIIINVLWVVDRLTGFTFRELLSFVKMFLLISLATGGLIALGYSLYSGYLSDLAGYIVSDKNPQMQIIVTYPIKIANLPTPETSAKSVLVVERTRSKILYEKNSNDKLAPASTVKLLTAMVALDLYSSTEELKVPIECTRIEGTVAGFPGNFTFKVTDLINSMLIGSAGDAACILASDRITNDIFVGLMNRKAELIGMTSTKISNPIGLDDVSGGNYSTASDLYKLAVYATNIAQIKEAVKTPVVITNSTQEKYSVVIYNTNKFLWEVPNTVGIKTGTTAGAGEVLIYEYADGLRDIVIIVMGSQDRFTDTKNILDWVLANYTWR